MKRVLSILIMILSVSLTSVTLEDCLNLAKEHNRELQVAREKIETVRAQYNEVRGSLLPQLTLSGGYTLSKTHLPKSSRSGSGESLTSLISPRDDLGNAVEPNNDDIFIENDSIMAAFVDGAFSAMIPDDQSTEGSLVTQLKLDQVIFMGGELINGLKVLDKVKTIQQKRYSLTEREVLHQTRNLFYQALLMQEVVRIQNESLRLARKHFERADLMYKQGLIPEYDRLRAEIEVARMVPDSVEAQKNLDLVTEQLRQQIGWGTDPLILEGELTVPDEYAPTLEEAIETGLNRRIEMDLSSINIDIREVQFETEEQNWWPRIFLSGEVNQFTAADELGIETDDFGLSYQIGLGFTMKLFTGFSNPARVAEARHELKISRIEHAGLHEKLSLEIRNAWLAHQRDLERLSARQSALRLAQRGHEIARTRWDNQVGIQLEVLESQVMLQAARVSYQEAVYAARMSWETLQKVTGMNQ